VSARGKAVGIDIGGTKIAVATVEASGQVVREATIPTEAERGFASGARRIIDTVRRVLEDSGWGGASWAGSASAAPVPSTPPAGRSSTRTRCRAGWVATS
jgi:glucokinase